MEPLTKTRCIGTGPGAGSQGESLRVPAEGNPPWPPLLKGGRLRVGRRLRGTPLAPPSQGGRLRVGARLRDPPWPPLLKGGRLRVGRRLRGPPWPPLPRGKVGVRGRAGDVSRSTDELGRWARGITLTEILIAIMILGVGLVSLATLFPIGLLRLRDATRYTRTKYLVDSAARTATARSLLNPTSFGVVDTIVLQYNLTSADVVTGTPTHVDRHGARSRRIRPSTVIFRRRDNANNGFYRGCFRGIPAVTGVPANTRLRPSVCV